MRGKARTTEEKHELFDEIGPHLKNGISVRKACEITTIPYSTMRDMIKADSFLRARMHRSQSEILSLAWATVKTDLQEGSVKTARWVIEKFGNLEPLSNAYEGGVKERDDRDRLLVNCIIDGMFE